MTNKTLLHSSSVDQACLIKHLLMYSSHLLWSDQSLTQALSVTYLGPIMHSSMGQLESNNGGRASEKLNYREWGLQKIKF